MSEDPIQMARIKLEHCLAGISELIYIDEADEEFDKKTKKKNALMDEGMYIIDYLEIFDPDWDWKEFSESWVEKINAARRKKTQDASY